jgi:hypothetical protein
MEALEGRRRKLRIHRSEVWSADSFFHFEVIREWLDKAARYELAVTRAREERSDALEALNARNLSLSALAMCRPPYESLCHIRKITPGTCRLGVGFSIRRLQTRAARFTETANTVSKLKRAVALEALALSRPNGEPLTADINKLMGLVEAALSRHVLAARDLAALAVTAARGAAVLHAATHSPPPAVCSRAACGVRGLLLAELLAVTTGGWPELVWTRAWGLLLPAFVLSPTLQRERTFKLKLGAQELWDLWWGDRVASRFCQTGTVNKLEIGGQTRGDGGGYFAATISLPKPVVIVDRAHLRRVAAAICHLLSRFHEGGFAVGDCLKSCFLIVGDEIGLGVPLTIKIGDASSFARDVLAAQEVLRLLGARVEGTFTSAAELYEAVEGFFCGICCCRRQVNSELLACSSGHLFCATCCCETTRTSGDLTGELRCPFGLAQGCKVAMAAAAERIGSGALEQLRQRRSDTRAAMNSWTSSQRWRARLRAAALAACNQNVQTAVAVLLEDVRDYVLVDRCPACGSGYDGFDGCAALTCAVCSCRFCAWCGANCGRDAHAHVLVCPENPHPGCWAASPEEYEAVRCKKRSVELNLLMAAAPACGALRRALTEVSASAS